jgi:spore maturation protein B
MSGFVDALSMLAIPVLLGVIPLYGWLRGLNVYETFVEGAEEGFRMAILMLPYLVGILVALSIFEGSGAMAAVTNAVAAPLHWLGVPAPVVPLMLVRPLSGGAALGMTADILHRYGPDSVVGRIASTLQSSTDTTFYVVTLYFGSVGIRHIRHALWIALIGDLAGFVAVILLGRMLWG